MYGVSVSLWLCVQSSVGWMFLPITCSCADVVITKRGCFFFIRFCELLANNAGTYYNRMVIRHGVISILNTNVNGIGRDAKCNWDLIISCICLLCFSQFFFFHFFLHIYWLRIGKIAFDS